MGTTGRFDRGEGVGEHQFILELARSGTGIVYLAVARGPAGHKVLAVKELRHELLDNEAAVAAFLDEAHVAARLNHPNLVRTIEVGSDGVRRFLAMEHVDGQLLQRVVRRAHRIAPAMPLRMHLRVVTEVLAALEYAHSLVDLDGIPLGLVHRHVSPESVSITYAGRVKLLDFGVALASGSVREDRAGTGRGESSYVAPECLYGNRVDGRADIFAVGAMLYEAMLWSGPAGIRQTALHGASDPALFAIIQRAMSGDPDARYPTARSMREDLEQYAARSKMVLPDARELSDLVSSLFAQEHRRQQAFIEARLNVLDDPSASEPSLGALSRFVLTPSAPIVSLAEPIHLSSPSSQQATIESPSQPPRIEPITAAPIAAPPASVPTRSRSIGSGIATSLAAIVAAGSVVLFARSRPHFATTSEVASSAPAQAPSAAPVQADPVPIVHMALRASPASARLYVDDAPVLNPYVTEHPRDTTPHRVRAEAAGYASTDETVAFDRDGEVALALTPRRPAARAYLSHPPPPPSSPAPLVAASAAPPPAVEVPTAHAPSPPISAIALPAPRPLREIRKENPYLQ